MLLLSKKTMCLKKRANGIRGLIKKKKKRQNGKS
jgi:hypothetical protein